MQSVGFKEWALVCEALGRGEQTILLRKGGIAEGRAGFGFRHSEFFLFPTFFHEQVVNVRGTVAEMPGLRDGEVEIRYFARVVEQWEVTSWKEAAALKPFHVLEEAVVKERFGYKKTGLQLALVRVFRLASVWRFPDAPRYGGCRSWIELPALPADIVFQPVLTDDAHEARATQMRSACHSSRAAARG